MTDEATMEMRAVGFPTPAGLRIGGQSVGDPDAELVKAARARPEGFVALYDRYFDRVFGYARLQLRDTAACEDVTSQVFTSALARIGEFRGDGSFAAWLFRIARNAVNDVHRERRAEPADVLADVVDPEPAPDDRVVLNERLERLRDVVALLRPEQRQLLALRYGAGLDFDEISSIVGSNAGALRVRVHRILEELRRRYPSE